MNWRENHAAQAKVQTSQAHGGAFMTRRVLQETTTMKQETTTMKQETTTMAQITITMSERRPIKIVHAEWPVIATAFRHDGVVVCQANHEWMIRVREHADGRRLVYGWLRAGNGGVVPGWSGAAGGFLVAPTGDKPDEDETVRSIRRVGGILDDDKLADACIGNLPAEDA